MKKLFFFFTLLLPMMASAHDIEVANADGVTIYYVFTNDNTELAVSFRGDNRTDFTDEYAGNVNIPVSVTYEGTDYPVTSIADFAFYNCSGLKGFTVPGSVTSIGMYAFNGCTSLTSVIIPSSVTSISVGLFKQCSGLTSITLPGSVTSISNLAFQLCTALTDVYCYADSVPTTARRAFDSSSYNTATLHVPESSIDSYKSATPWSDFGDFVALVYKCAIPTITFAHGEFTFNSETEGVEFHYALSLIGETEGAGSKIPAASSYRICVYATKDGYEDSDVASMDIDLSTTGDVNGDGLITISDAVAIVNIILGNNSASSQP